jgi:hypothetical protein
MDFRDTFSKLRYELERSNTNTFTGKIVEVNEEEKYTVIETPLGRKKVPQNAYDRVGARRIRVSTDMGEVDTPL